MYYDPMIAKLVTWADAQAAIERMREALDAFHIAASSIILPFLAALMAIRAGEGRLTTAFIAEEYPDGFATGGPRTSGSR